MRKKENLLREVILNDRLMLSRDTADMICYDLKTVLSEYFNLLGDVSISVEPEKDFYKITVITSAVAIKSFGIIK
jgi:hypothetical protein